MTTDKPAVIVNVSLAGSDRDYDQHVTLLDTDFHLRRIGTNGDVAAAEELVREWADEADHEQRSESNSEPLPPQPFTRRHESHHGKHQSGRQRDRSKVGQEKQQCAFSQVAASCTEGDADRCEWGNERHSDADAWQR